jgi:hypothetical protein
MDTHFFMGFSFLIFGFRDKPGMAVFWDSNNPSALKRFCTRTTSELQRLRIAVVFDANYKKVYFFIVGYAAIFGR